MRILEADVYLSIMSVFGLCRPFMFDMYALLVIFDGIKCYVLVPPIAEITLSTQSFIIILIEIWTFNIKLDGSIFLDYMFVSGISIDSLKGLSTGMCTFLSVIYDGV